MFVINKDTNTITSLSRKPFSELSVSEKNHLQEWIAQNPKALGEELLIIQKEFDEFAGTCELCILTMTD